MDASADHPQIGRITVDRAALSGPGTELAAALGALEFDVSMEGVPSDTPASGWRVLAHPAYAVVLGAPVDDGSRWWRIAQVIPARDGSRTAEMHVHPEPQPLRPSPAERSRGLVLRWPETTRTEPDFDRLALDVVNTGEYRWRPDGDSFTAIGFITRPGGGPGSGSFAFVGGGPPAFALDPGEYARVQVSLNPNQWEGREPGRHEISAVLMDLGLRTVASLEVQLTAELIDQYQPRHDRARPPRPSRSIHTQE
ncbi:hypothetical protein ASE14_11070 [Agromyces sp. Root81]|uniref:hypothetical protein n=1 Tax=Agromyces sp. Root81 TaxID=1736601 RepID=UPI0006F7F691|nr:hypothetical protein [Agromyces sp. Root81]KRC61411.1 hypothetical protein ASE14_11070 [Agromyces sp. Root81]